MIGLILVILIPGLLNIDQVLFGSDKLIMYGIKYIKGLNSSNSFYLVFNNLDVYITKSGENRYLIFASIDKNKSVGKLHRTLG